MIDVIVLGIVIIHLPLQVGSIEHRIVEKNRAEFQPDNVRRFVSGSGGCPTGIACKQRALPPRSVYTEP